MRTTHGLKTLATLALMLAFPVTTFSADSPDLSGTYPLEGHYLLVDEGGKESYTGSVTLKRQATVKLPIGEMDWYLVTWEYEKWTPNNGVAVLVGNVLCFAYAQSPRTEISLVVPNPLTQSERAAAAADYKDKLENAYATWDRVDDRSLYPGMKPTDNLLSFSFQSDDYVRIWTMSGPAGFEGEYEREGVSINKRGKRLNPGMTSREKFTLTASGPGWNIDGRGSGTIVASFDLAGAALRLNDSLWILGATGPNWNPNAVGFYLIRDNKLNGEAYSRGDLSLYYETLAVPDKILKRAPTFFAGPTPGP